LLGAPPGIPLGPVPGDAFAVVLHNRHDYLGATTLSALRRSIVFRLRAPGCYRDPEFPLY